MGTDDMILWLLLLVERIIRKCPEAVVRARVPKNSVSQDVHTRDFNKAFLYEIGQWCVSPDAAMASTSRPVTQFVLFFAASL